jgi:hypothetical protein
MTPKFLPTLTALSIAATALVPGATALAQDDPAAAAAPAKIEITKAYAYLDKTTQPPTTTATVVFKTKDPLPRRNAGKGMIQASGYLDAAGHSIAGVRGAHGKAANCYVIYTPIRYGKIAGTGKSAKAGTKHTLKVTAHEGGATDSISVTLRKEKPGDATGKPLGC